MIEDFYTRQRRRMLNDWQESAKIGVWGVVGGILLIGFICWVISFVGWG